MKYWETNFFDDANREIQNTDLILQRDNDTDRSMFFDVVWIDK